jgi:hypothetical protein
MKTPQEIEQELRNMASQFLGYEFFIRAADLIHNGAEAVTMLRAFRKSMDSNLPFPSMEKLNSIIENQNKP